MNKRFLHGILAAASMLFTISCSNEGMDEAKYANEAQVSFSIGLEGEIASRAISDGKGANVLVYAVFDKDGNRLSNIKAVTKTGVTFPTTASFTLAKGQTYKVAFWAQDGDCEAYTVDTDKMSVAVNYANGANNDEARDAFFKTVEFTLTGSTSIDVELRRPLAQINVGVYKTDWDAAVASGIEIEKSSVIITNAATSIDLLTGAVGEETTDVVVSYTPGTIPNEELKIDLDKNGEIDDNEKFKWLSMSYILVADHDPAEDENGLLGSDRTTLQNLQYKFAPKKGDDIVFNEGLNNVPVQRNWRTNILGRILTGDVQFNISINPVYDGDIFFPDAPTE